MKMIAKYVGIVLGLAGCMIGTYVLSYKLSYEAIVDINEYRMKKLEANEES